MLLRKSTRAGIYCLPWHPAGTLPCRIEYCLASLGFIFCLSDTSCRFLFVFLFSLGGEARHSFDREQQGHCRTLGDIFPLVRKEITDFCHCLKHLSVYLCVWCLNVMCEEYLAPSNLLNPKKRTFDQGILRCIRVLGSQKELRSLGF